MGMSAAKWIDRWHEKQERMKLGLRNSRVHRLLGDRLFNQHVWGCDRRSVAGGVALGLFVAFTPTIPFHMLLCAFGAIFLRVNLGVCEAAVWVTNPVTAVPVYFAAERLGRFLCAHTRLLEIWTQHLAVSGRAGKVMQEGLYVWVGSLVFATAAAAAGYGVALLLWDFYHRRRKDKAANTGSGKAG